MRPELLTREEDYYHCPFCRKAPIQITENDFYVHLSVHTKDMSPTDVAKWITKEHFYAFTKKY